MKKLLEKKGFDREVCNSILGRLIENGFLNDHVFASLFVEQRRNKRSAYALKVELLGKGIDPGIINDILSEIGPPEEYKTALELIRKKIRLSGGTCSRSSIAFFLRRKGFCAEVIGKLCATLTGN